jgi:hypothetical protein
MRYKATIRDGQLYVEISLDLLNLLKGEADTNSNEECAKPSQNWRPELSTLWTKDHTLFSKNFA